MKKAFTLIDVLVMTILLGILYAGAISLSNQTIINNQFNTLVQETKKALHQSQKLSKEKYLNVTSGVYLTQAGFTTFHADSFSPSDTRNETTEFPNNVTIENISYSDGIVQFTLFSGAPNTPGNFSIESTTGKSAAFTINTIGLITITYN